MTDVVLNKVPTSSRPLVSAGADIAPPRTDMIWIARGTFHMGSDRHYPEEAPVHRVTVDGFWMDRAPVTNAQFRSAPSILALAGVDTNPARAEQAAAAAAGNVRRREAMSHRAPAFATE